MGRPAAARPRHRHGRPGELLRGRPAALSDPAWVAAFWVLFLARRDDLLEVDARRRVYQVVRDYPGLHLREIARNVDMDPNHVKYHLRRLEKAEMVSSRKDGRYLRFHPTRETAVGQTDAQGADEKRVLAYLRRPLPLHIVALLLDQGPSSATDLAKKTGQGRTTLIHHLEGMERDGLLHRERSGRSVLYGLVDADLTMRCLLEHQPPDALVQGFLDAWEALRI